MKPTAQSALETMPRTIEPRVKFVIDNVGSGKILDVGCSVGFVANLLTDKGEVTGVDSIKEVLDRARKMHPNIKFIQANAENLSKKIPKESFDYIVSTEMIEHIEYPNNFLNEAYKVLKKDGHLVITTQNANALQYRIRMVLGRFTWDKDHLCVYSKNEIIEEVKKAGFSIESVKMLPIHKQGLGRTVIHYLSRIYPNFGWTTGIVARK